MKLEIENEALLCAGAFEIPSTISEVVMWMPGGLQTITPFGGGIGQPIPVMVDRGGALAIEQQRQALTAKGKRPYFDFEHEDGGASYWPSEFFWAESPKPGIYARGEWTSDGESGVKGKKWRQFSPVFHVDNKRATPARLVCNLSALPNMGGLVNNAAFSNILPLWAKDAGGALSTFPIDPDMKPKEETTLEALQAKNDELQTELTRLKGEATAIKAKNENDSIVQALIAQRQAEVDANNGKIELAALKAKNDTQAAEILKTREADAKRIVGEAVSRGAIAAKDNATIAAWEKDITENPDRGALLAKMQGHPALAGNRITAPASGVQVQQNSVQDIISGYGAVLAKNAAIPLTVSSAKEKGQLAREAAAIFAADIDKNVIFQSMPIEEAIKAADFNDVNGNVGLLSGSLVMQRALPKMAYEYSLLGNIATDFSDEPSVQNQTANTRITMKPAVQTYDPTLGSDGRPLGWTVASPAQSIDVPVTLSDYVGVPIVFGQSVLASTTRKLFEEVAPMAINALGGYATGMLTSLMTAANFNGYAGSTIGTGATTSGSKNITFASNAIVYPGMAISGAGIPANSFIVSVTSATAATINKNATATATGLTFTLGTGKVPTPYATYVKALANFAVASLDDIAVAFDINEVPMADRFALLSPSYHRKLGSDASVNGAFAAWQNPEIITERRYPKLAGFECQNAPWMPTTNNRTGFAGTKAALVLKSRLPQDISGALQGVNAPGSVTTITDPATGLSILLVQYVNLQGNFAEWRPEILLGAAVGERRAGMVITSA